MKQRFYVEWEELDLGGGNALRQVTRRIGPFTTWSEARAERADRGVAGRRIVIER